MRHFERDLEQLKAKLLEMSALVETAIYGPFAVLALIDWRARPQVRHGTHADARDRP